MLAQKRWPGNHAGMDAPGGILIVDDEPLVCSALSRLLNPPYHTLTAEDGESALKLLETEPVDVIISDYNMPGMSGVDLLKLVRVRHPKVVRIMLTGEHDPEIPVRSINESEVYRFLRKPPNPADLRTIVSFAFQIARLEQEKRYLIMLLRKQAASPSDPADIEAEILKLAEEETQQE